MTDWEWLDHLGSLCRLKVPGGWLVKTSNPFPFVMSDNSIMHYDYVMESITFVPDPNHEWEV